MRRVFLTVGPQWAGKSAFCKRVLRNHPDVVYISRDQILIELFGTVWLDNHTGGHYVGWDHLWEKVQEELRQEDVTILLDAWNEGPRDRQDIVRKLHDRGAEEVRAWYFITPLSHCVSWYMRDEDSFDRPGAKYGDVLRALRESNYLEHHCGFHEWTTDLETEFDSVIRINPMLSSYDPGVLFRAA